MKTFSRQILLGSALTTIFFVLFLYFNWKEPTNELLIATPYFIVIYFLIFNLGQPDVNKQLREYLHLGNEKVLFFTVFLLFLLFSYLIIHGETPFEGSAGLFAFLLLFPVLMFLSFKKTKIVWSDFVILLLFLIPATIVSFKGNTSLPYKGNGFSSIYKITLILSAAYAFGVVRRIQDIGFYPIFNIKFLGIAVFSWLSFLGFVFVIGFVYDFIVPNPFESFSVNGIPLGVKELIRVFIGTALFEELFFRGLIQNMLAKKIGQQGNWQKYWIVGFIIFLIFSLITGYALNKQLFWFPSLICILLFSVAYFVEKKQISAYGVYTALAITSIFFGLVHFHAGSIIFVGLASVAGWAYGFTYLKTKNVFYAALVHTLVNTCEFLFALDGLK
jgi:uncharacterized protein